MLKNKEIDGAWVTKTAFENGELTYKTYIATTEEEIRDASSSVYMNIPILKHIDVVRNFDGKVAVVMTPCMLRGLDTIMKKINHSKIRLFLNLVCTVVATILLRQLPSQWKSQVLQVKMPNVFTTEEDIGAEFPV